MAVIYIVTANGMVMTTHLCMGKKVTKNCLCSKSKEGEKSDCCKDEVKVVKLENFHKASADNIIIQPSVALLSSNFSTTDPVKLPGESLKTPPANGPPLPSVPLYILNSVFLI